MNLPMIPGQNNKGKKGARVVTVPESTGTKTSPAAIFAARTIGTFPLPNIRCVFSITTMASSTIIPNPNNNANNTIKLSVTFVPTIKSARWQKHKCNEYTQRHTQGHKEGIGHSHKEHQHINTRIKPITIVLISSLKEVLCLHTLVTGNTTSRSFGNYVLFISSTIAFTFSEVLIRFSPARLTICRVTTFLLLIRE